jgi:hypothetical protein
MELEILRKIAAMIEILSVACNIGEFESFKQIGERGAMGDCSRFETKTRLESIKTHQSESYLMIVGCRKESRIYRFWLSQYRRCKASWDMNLRAESSGTIFH